MHPWKWFEKGPPPGTLLWRRNRSSVFAAVTSAKRCTVSSRNESTLPLGAVDASGTCACGPIGIAITASSDWIFCLPSRLGWNVTSASPGLSSSSRDLRRPRGAKEEGSKKGEYYWQYGIYLSCWIGVSPPSHWIYLVLRNRETYAGRQVLKKNVYGMNAMMVRKPTCQAESGRYIRVM